MPTTSQGAAQDLYRMDSLRVYVSEQVMGERVVLVGRHAFSFRIFKPYKPTMSFSKKNYKALQRWVITMAKTCTYVK